MVTLSDIKADYSTVVMENMLLWKNLNDVKIKENELSMWVTN